MGFAFVPLYVKYVGIEAYGLIGIFGVLATCLGLLDMGMTPTLSREMASFKGGGHSPESIRDLLRSIEVIAFAIATVIACGIALSSTMLATNWLKPDGLSTGAIAQAFSIMGLVIALRFVEGVYRSCLAGLQRQVILNVINCILATVRGVGAVGLLAWVSPTIQAFFIWQGLVSVITLSVLGIVTYASLPFGERSGRFSLPALNGVWRFAGGMITISLLSMLFTQTDKILLSKLLSLSEFGSYTLAGVIAGATYTFVNPITLAWYPQLTQFYAAKDQAGLARAFHQGAQLVSVIHGSACLVLIAFAETFLRFWTQDATLAVRTAPLVSLLVLGNLLHGLVQIPYYAQLAHGWTRLSINICIIALILLVPAIFLVTPRYGPIGAAWVWACFNAGHGIFGIHFMFKRILISEKWSWYFEDVALPLMSSVALVTFLRYAIPQPVGALNQACTLIVVSCVMLIGSGLMAPMIRSEIFSQFVKWYRAVWRKDQKERITKSLT